jgi:hypothetical protein
VGRTWFRLENEQGGPLELSGSAAAGSSPGAGGGVMYAHLRCHVTGAYINYRVEDFVRGHGNSLVGGQWVASPRTPSTRILAEVP